MVPALIEAVMRRTSSQLSPTPRKSSALAIKGASCCARVDDIEPPIGQVANARREANPQEVAKAEDVIDRAGGIGVVLAAINRAFMVHQPVQNVRSLAGVRGDDLGIKRRVTVGDMGVELH